MGDKKEGMNRKNIFDLVLIFSLAIFLVFVINFASAGTNIGIINITNASEGQFNASFNYDSGNNSGLYHGLPNFVRINEQIMYRFNLSISHLSATQNLTGINIILPAAFSFAVGSNSTGNITGSTSVYFVQNGNATAPTRALNGSTLSWNATTGITTANGWIINYTGTSNYTFIAFNTTAYTPGNYNITVRFIYNNTQINTAVNYNETSIAIIVNDTTAPFNVNLSDLPLTYANISGSQLINLSVFDKGNMTAGAREYDVTGVNITIYNNTGGVNASYTMTNVTGNYWNFTLVTTQFPDGIYNISLFVNDTNGNVNSTNISNVIIDNTAPTGAVTCTPTSVYRSQTVTCSCSSSDALSGVNSTAGNSVTSSPSTGETGIFTNTCSFIDLAGNSGTASTTYTVTQTSTSTGGTTSSGGGASTPAIPVTTTQAFNTITPSTPATMSNFGTDTVKQIQIEVTQTAINVNVKVDRYDSKPAAVLVDKADSYKYLHIETQNLTGKLSKATMTIQINKTWVSGKGLAKEEVALYRYEESTNVWTLLPTTFGSEDSNYYTYNVALDHFSYFAIAPNKAQVQTPTTPVALTGFLGLPYWAWVAIVLAILIIGGGIVLKHKLKRKK